MLIIELFRLYRGTLLLSVARESAVLVSERSICFLKVSLSFFSDCFWDWATSYTWTGIVSGATSTTFGSPFYLLIGSWFALSSGVGLLPSLIFSMMITLSYSYFSVYLVFCLSSSSLIDKSLLDSTLVSSALVFSWVYYTVLYDCRVLVFESIVSFCWCFSLTCLKIWPLLITFCPFELTFSVGLRVSLTTCVGYCYCG